jgi:hypothetical protein
MDWTELGLGQNYLTQQLSPFVGPLVHHFLTRDQLVTGIFQWGLQAQAIVSLIQKVGL